MHVSGAQPRELVARLDVDPDALLAAIVDAAEDPVLVCDSDGRIATWGNAAARLFGRPADAAVGAPFVEMFAEDVRPAVLAILGRGAAGEHIDRFETECVREDGMPVPVSINVSPLLGPNMMTRALIAVVRDETERRLAQATLAEADARLREGEAFSHVGSWLWDIRTNVVQWSVEFHRIHGVDPLDFGGTLDAYLQAVHPADREAFRKAVSQSVTTGRGIEFEYRSANEADGPRRVLVRTQVIGPPGPVVGLRGVGRVVDQS